MNVRSAERRNCRMNSAVRYMKQIADCRIINISHTGLGLELYTSFHAAAGSTIIVENDDLGLVEGIVRWSRGGRLGVQFRHNSNSIAKVTAYFRNFHQDVNPVLKR
ncbi:PilZ domain-containing protein [Rhizobium sp.]|uniref:PilZ domain-containing protein n=1 Tax=Rhizobium sp. TaxID=391 RepID=UPI002AA90EC0